MICLKCGAKFPCRIKVNGTSRVLRSRKYCLSCSPFKRHNTRKIHISDMNTRCLCCGNGTESGRKFCESCSVKIRRWRLKLAAIDYKGAKCALCGRECSDIADVVCFDFHHRDKSAKDFSITQNLNMSIDRLRAELDKCDLLCVWCHRRHHVTLSPAFIARVEERRLRF